MAGRTNTTKSDDRTKAKRNSRKSTYNCTHADACKPPHPPPEQDSLSGPVGMTSPIVGDEFSEEIAASGSLANSPPASVQGDILQLIIETCSFQQCW